MKTCENNCCMNLASGHIPVTLTQISAAPCEAKAIPKLGPQGGNNCTVWACGNNSTASPSSLPLILPHPPYPQKPNYKIIESMMRLLLGY